MTKFTPESTNEERLSELKWCETLISEGLLKNPPKENSPSTLKLLNEIREETERIINKTKTDEPKTS